MIYYRKLIDSTFRQKRRSMILFINILLLSLGCMSVGMWTMYQSGMLNGIREPKLALSIALYCHHIITPALTMVLSLWYKVGYPPIHVLFGVLVIYHWYYLTEFFKGNTKSTYLSQLINLMIALYPIVVVFS